MRAGMPYSGATLVATETPLHPSIPFDSFPHSAVDAEAPLRDFPTSHGHHCPPLSDISSPSALTSDHGGAGCRVGNGTDGWAFVAQAVVAELLRPYELQLRCAMVRKVANESPGGLLAGKGKKGRVSGWEPEAQKQTSHRHQRTHTHTHTHTHTVSLVLLESSKLGPVWKLPDPAHTREAVVSFSGG